MATSTVRQNYHSKCEEGINGQINLELYAMYTYLSMVRSTIFADPVLRLSMAFRLVATTDMMWHSQVWPNSSGNLHGRS